MTSSDPDTSPDAGQPVDKILDHNRMQLSALIDGELSPDAARFLLRRLAHDVELGGCWERWQACGDILRGRSSELLPAGFSGRVAHAIAAEHTAPGIRTRSRDGKRTGYLRWGGAAAAAASVAVLAMFMSRQATEMQVQPVRAPVVAMQARDPSIAPDSAASPAGAGNAATTGTRGNPDHTGQLAGALAVADVPKRLVSRRSRGQAQRAAVRALALRTLRVATPGALVASAQSDNTVVADPFSGHRVSLPSRPWPRALLPGSPAPGGFTVDYGSSSLPSRTLYPFVPRVAPAAAPPDASTGAEPHH